MGCSAEYDPHGTTFNVPAANIVVTPGAKTRASFPGVQVWWSRSFKDKSEETLVIRQEYPERDTADVLELTLGQTYDLIDALCKAVENT